MTTTAGSVFDSDTASERVGEHEFALTLSDRWTTLIGSLNGGFLLAGCLQALRREVPHPDLLSASAHFLRPGTPGPARISTEVARTGRRTSTGQATLVRDDREIVRVLATFADLDAADGPTLVGGEPPVLPPPDQCVDPYPRERPTISQQTDTRMAQVPGFWRGDPTHTTTAEFWLRLSDGRDADPIALAFLVDAAAPVVFDLGVAGSSTIELTVHIRHRPAPGWLACRVSTNYLIDGFHEEDFEIWDSTGTLVAQSRQLAIVST
ncbi:acyl-CoA thioesterase [Nocardia tenerifensis]|uniref:Acyl-CoA thioesterase n=1 Tax=Nocardia tenerifensis TaxID=228006 RepID=A0A318KFJ4_9NOCA|nr:thioesterase family protein [Nocardia tenerifensis]PXX71012.1 acyl-CoA thioesterase [Nocardia tenerifensis]